MDKRKRLSVYLDALQPDMPDYLSKIEKRAVDCDVPIIRRESRYFMKTLLWIIRPGRILEIGTAVAFSALFFHELCSRSLPYRYNRKL
jgi:predicted O-methyltransferase YrrM